MEAMTISSYFRKFHCEGELRNGVVAVWEYGVKGDFSPFLFFNMGSSRSLSGREWMDDVEEKE